MSKLSEYKAYVPAVNQLRSGSTTQGTFVKVLNDGTVSGVNVIETPTPLYPLNLGTGVGRNSVLEASPYSSAFGKVRDFRRFQIKLTSSPNWDTPTYSEDVDSDFSTGSVSLLASSTSYDWRCADFAQDGSFSDWSEVQTFTTGSAYVNAPTVDVEGSPASLLSDPNIITNAFSVTGDTDTHLATDWEVRDSNDDIVFSSYNDMENLLELKLPFKTLLPNSSYTFYARHIGTTYRRSTNTSFASTTRLTDDIDGYFAITSTTTPFLKLYYEKDAILKSSPLSTDVNPTGTANGMSFSVSGKYLAIAHNTTPFVTIYKRNGDVFEKLPDPATLPTGNANGAVFSADDKYLAISHTVSPYITIYKRTGDVFDKLPDPATIPPNTANGAAFSGDGRFLTVAFTTTPFIYTYEIANDVFSVLPNPATTPPSAANAVCYSKQSDKLGVVFSSTPFVYVYDIKDDVFEVQPVFGGTAINNVARGVAFSPDGNYFAVVYATSPFIAVYKRKGNFFYRMTAVINGNLPSQGYGCRFTPDSKYLMTNHLSTPYITVYYIGDGEFIKINNPTELSNNNAFGGSVYPSGIPGSG